MGEGGASRWFVLISVHVLLIATNWTTVMCVYSQYNICFKLHTMINVLGCVTLSILSDACVSLPLLIPAPSELRGRRAHLWRGPVGGAKQRRGGDGHCCVEIMWCLWCLCCSWSTRCVNSGGKINLTNYQRAVWYLLLTSRKTICSFNFFLSTLSL